MVRGHTIKKMERLFNKDHGTWMFLLKIDIYFILIIFII